MERAKKLRNVEGSKSLDQSAKERAGEANEGTSTNNISNWKAPNSLFCIDSWDELVNPFGFLRRTSQTRSVSEAIERLKVTVVPSLTNEKEPVSSGVREPVVS